MQKDLTGLNASIVGAGPVGTLLSIYLAKKGCNVNVYEKRADPRKNNKAEGRSINIALSHRGIRALNEIGFEEKIKSIAIPMKGRMIHNAGATSFLPYGTEDQMIYSVSRNELSQLLINNADTEHQIQFFFDTTCKEIKTETSELLFSHKEKSYSEKSDIIIGADGAFSSVRKSFTHFNDFTYSQEKLSHSYVELHLPAGKDGKHQMEKNALHIWPRGQFMLIALPNMDGSFTCTLFLPQEGSISFNSIKTDEECIHFFQQHFPDAISLMPDYLKNYFANPPSSLITVHCFPWNYHNTILLGDAAHAITPFYGQGMNAGFEDCRILNKILDSTTDLNLAFLKFQKERKSNADAIGELALQNFIEMRDLVADKDFQLRKKIEAVIHSRMPSYLPLYTMVTFSDIPYEEALQKGKQHDELMKKVMRIEGIETAFLTEAGWKKIEAIIIAEK